MRLASSICRLLFGSTGRPRLVAACISLNDFCDSCCTPCAKLFVWEPGCRASYAAIGHVTGQRHGSEHYPDVAPLRCCAVEEHVVRLHDGRFRHLLFIYAHLGTLERVDHFHITIHTMEYIPCHLPHPVTWICNSIINEMQYMPIMACAYILYFTPYAHRAWQATQLRP